MPLGLMERSNAYTFVQVAVFFLSFFSSPSFVRSSTYYDTKFLLHDLLDENTYDKRVRPVKDQNEAMDVQVDLFLMGVINIDEVQGSMTTTVFLDIRWEDGLLKWTESMYNGTKHIYIPQSDIWKPDIAVNNGFTKRKELGDPFTLVTVQSYGTVSWQPFEILETKCSINIRFFPFDKQVCNLEFGVWTSNVNEIGVIVGSKGIRMDTYQGNGEWDVLKTAVLGSGSNVFNTEVKFSITLQRKPGYIMVNVVLPILLLSILSTCTFLLPVDSGEKMSFSVTLYLSFAVFLTIVGSSLPETSTMSLLSMYLVVLSSIGTAVIIITSIQIRLHYRDSSFEIPWCVRGLVRISRQLHCRRSLLRIQRSNQIDEIHIQNESTDTQENVPKTDIVTDGSEISPMSDRPGSKQGLANDDITWPDVTSAIDFYGFWIFSIAIIMCTVLLFTNGYIQANFDP
ncbi:acetylcholine receptor subunit alpha-like [Ylistrum balloti]|uniref:acetylcholine receptor subunit alpha-like n=1 Tax=Ylistrum balloti TaxID=509963 RepID=UPI0029058D99|nr:acetylcholine receptor subunit alpha-like [Ylistrum balloti]